MGDVYLLDVDKIESNTWNPNLMSKEAFETLKKDMQAHGVDGVDPLLVSPRTVFYHSQPAQVDRWVIVDGEHRWRSAADLGWKQIRCQVENIKEAEAKEMCYRRNRERGTIDPFKEAALFKTERSLSQAQVAKKYGVDQTTVSHRLSLLRLSPDVAKESQNMPRGNKLTVSHLEPISSLPEGDQKVIMSKIKQEMQWREAVPPVKAVEEHVEELKAQREMEKRLREALEKAKFPKCPFCGKQPGQIHTQKGLPWVCCSSEKWEHVWNLDTGKTMYAQTRTVSSEGKLERPLPQTLRSNYTVAEIHAAFVKAIKEIVPNMEIGEIRVSGKLDKAHFSFDLNSYSHAMSVSVEIDRKHEGFRAEEHNYRSGEKTTVHCGSPNLIEKTKKFIERVFKGELLKENAPVEHRQSEEEEITTEAIRGDP